MKFRGQNKNSFTSVPGPHKSRINKASGAIYTLATNILGKITNFTPIFTFGQNTNKCYCCSFVMNIVSFFYWRISHHLSLNLRLESDCCHWSTRSTITRSCFETRSKTHCCDRNLWNYNFAFLYLAMFASHLLNAHQFQKLSLFAVSVSLLFLKCNLIQIKWNTTMNLLSSYFLYLKTSVNCSSYCNASKLIISFCIYLVISCSPTFIRQTPTFFESEYINWSCTTDFVKPHHKPQKALLPHATSNYYF